MARHFGGAGAAQLLTVNVAATPALPCTMACWVKYGGATGGEFLIAQTEVGVHKGFFLNLLDGKVVGQTYDGSSTPNATGVTPLVAGVWGHAAAVINAPSGIVAYRNGVADGTYAGATTVATTPAETNIGAGTSVARLYFTGDLAEAAIWNVALTADLVAGLARGVSPIQIRPEALVAYWPLLGQYAPEIDVWRGRGLTLVNAPTAAAHAPVILPIPAFPKRTSNVIYHIAGVTKDLAGNPIAGATVKLFRSSDDVKLFQTVSDGVGAYSFDVPGGVQFYCVAYKSGAPDVAGTTINTLTGA